MLPQGLGLCPCVASPQVLPDGSNHLSRPGGALPGGHCAPVHTLVLASLQLHHAFSIASSPLGEVAHSIPSPGQGRSRTNRLNQRVQDPEDTPALHLHQDSPPEAELPQSISHGALSSKELVTVEFGKKSPGENT